ncbi:MAG TPA: ATP-binding protein [Myxococcales bacterium]|nr:ATP-binding protein [Myxococcales bacterium]
MTRSLTARVCGIAFGVELIFAVAIPMAYLHLFAIERSEDRAPVLAIVGALYLVRTAALIGYLAWLLRPIDRWLVANDSSSPPTADLTRRAARAAYDTPLLFPLVWATSWLLFYLPVTASLQHWFADQIPLSARAGEATALFGLSCFAAALPLSYAILSWLLGPIAGRVSLSLRKRGLPLPGRRLSVRARLVVLSLSLITAPTSWMGVHAYMSQVWTAQRNLAARAGVLADSLARELAQSPERAETAVRSLSTPLDLVAVATTDGTIVVNRDAARELAAAPQLQHRLARALSRAPADAVLDPDAQRALAYRSTPIGGGAGSVALAISRQPERDRGGELFTLVLFALIALSWAPICAAFLAGSIARPLGRIRAVVTQIVARGDVEKLGRIPIFHRDELGELAQGVNEMIDRLQASAGRIRRYGAEREQALAVAARRAAELDAVLDNMVEGVFACDKNGAVTHMNSAGMRLLELSSAGAGARAPLEAAAGGLGPVHPDGRPFSAAELPLLRALAGEVIVEEDDVLENPSNYRRVFLRFSAAPIRHRTGEIAGAVAVARDVTEVAEFDRLKDEFIRVAAHELKTPVAILKGYALTLKRTDPALPARSRRMLEAIDRGAERINRVVDDLLDISQARFDTLHLSPAPVDLDELVRGAVASVHASELHRIVVRCEDPAPLMVRADSARTRQALRNLLSNALKYSPAGGTIEVVLSADRERAEARASVRDFGIGIPAQRQVGIFRLFYRAHTDTPHDYGGLGVGLYMAKELIKRQGGRIWFESREGEGSTFSFTLPLV